MGLRAASFSLAMIFRVLFVLCAVGFVSVLWAVPGGRPQDAHGYGEGSLSLWELLVVGVIFCAVGLICTGIGKLRSKWRERKERLAEQARREEAE